MDLRRETARPDEKGVPLFSRPLLERLREVFARGEQAILLQPRRGFAPFLLCRDCGHDFRCAQCSVARTVHDRGRTLLVCHYCGERVAAAGCGAPNAAARVLEAIGAGHRARRGAVRRALPGRRRTRSSTATRRAGGGGAAAVVEDMASGRIACLIGTQMVAKGHDFPGVTAVGVLSADTLLHFPDFRAAEKTFQLLAQVAGRAGRGDAPGTVHVQTFHPRPPGDPARGRARRRGLCRRRARIPAGVLLSAVLASSPRSSSPRPTASGREPAAAELGEALRRRREALRLSGPAPAPLERLQGRWRFQILLRAADRRAVLAALAAAVPERPPAGVQIAVDVDPQDLM